MRWDIVNALLEETKEKRFLEIGVQNGECAARVRAVQKWGVDPEPRQGARQRHHELFVETSDGFFAVLDPEKKFDVVFVDGLHHADQVLRDVDNALAHLSDDGWIVIHDCSPASELAQRVPRATGVWNGNVWKAMVELRQRPDLDSFTVDEDHGVGVVRRRPNRDRLGPQRKGLTYADLDADRVRLLGLVDTKDWKKRAGLVMPRIEILSANFGNRDEPVDVPEGEIPFILFSDDAGKFPRGWRIVREKADDPRRTARRIKTLALEYSDADVVVWIDARVRPTGLPIRPAVMAGLVSSEIAACAHPWRNCVYEEAIECATLNLDTLPRLELQKDAYRAAGYPEHAGLWSTGVLARKRSARMIEFGRAWWDEIQRYSIRDQISFPFVLRKMGVPCATFPEIDLYKNVHRQTAKSIFVLGYHRGYMKKFFKRREKFFKKVQP